MPPTQRPKQTSRARSRRAQTRERAAIRIARAIVDQIRRDELRPGTPLPAEHVMVEEFGVARATVREALRFLELQGALRIKAGPGGGPIVSTPGPDHLASALSLHLQFADASFRSVVEARCSIYPVLAAEAAAKAEPDDIEVLRASVARLRAGQGDPDLFRDEARRFMDLIAAASGNPVLALLVGSLHRMSGESSEWTERQRRLAIRDYERALGAIEAGDVEQARQVIADAMVAARRSAERIAPDQFKRPVAWMASGH